MGRDKKVVAGTLHFVAAPVLGKTVTLTDVTEAEVRAALKELSAFSLERRPRFAVRFSQTANSK